MAIKTFLISRERNDECSPKTDVCLPYAWRFPNNLSFRIKINKATSKLYDTTFWVISINPLVALILQSAPTGKVIICFICPCLKLYIIALFNTFK